MSSDARPTNNFDGLRLLAAVAVVVGHAFVLTDAGPAPEILGFTIHKLGVAVFFCISGYLIAGSWYRTGSAPLYLWHRLLRIIPALWVLVIVTVFLVGPLASRLSLGEYFRSPVTWEYLINLTTAATYRLPGVFDDNPLPAVNGSLWTIGVEVLCYLVLLGVAVAARRFAGLAFAMVAILMATASFTVATKDGALAGFSDAAPVIVYFFLGAVMKSVERSTGVRWTPRYAVAASIVWVTIYLTAPGSSLALSWLLLPLCVIPVGLASWPVLRSGGRFGDISYGVYLWGFLVQQLVIQFFGPMNLAVNISVVLLITIALSLGSCHLVERPALSLKDRLPAFRRQRISHDIKIGPTW